MADEEVNKSHYLKKKRVKTYNVYNDIGRTLKSTFICVSDDSIQQKEREDFALQ